MQRQCHYSTSRSGIYADVPSTMKTRIMRTEWRWRTRSRSKLKRRRISQSRRASVSERSWNKVFIRIHMFAYVMRLCKISVYMSNLFYMYLISYTICSNDNAMPFVCTTDLCRDNHDSRNKDNVLISI